MRYTDFVKQHIKGPEVAHLKQTDKFKAIAAMWRKQKGGDLLGEKIATGGKLVSRRKPTVKKDKLFGGDLTAADMLGGKLMSRKKPSGQKGKLFGGDVVQLFRDKAATGGDYVGGNLHCNASSEYMRGYNLPFKFKQKCSTK